MTPFRDTFSITGLTPGWAGTVASTRRDEKEMRYGAGGAACVQAVAKARCVPSARERARTGSLLTPHMMKPYDNANMKRAAIFIVIVLLIVVLGWTGGNIAADRQRRLSPVGFDIGTRITYQTTGILISLPIGVACGIAYVFLSLKKRS